jgi:error-prone DNA polymerase
MSAMGKMSGFVRTAEGRVEREVAQAKVPITHLIVERLIDRSDLLSRLVEIDGGDTLDHDWTEQSPGRADEVRRPEPGSQRPKPKLPGSRDFR